MSSRKIRIKNSKSGKHRLPNIQDIRRCKILLLLANELLPYTIAQQLGISKQLVWKDINWMIRGDWLIDIHPEKNKYKYYRLTDLGKQILDGFGKNEKKRLFKIENARHIVIIQNAEKLQDFLKKPEYNFKLTNNLKNVPTYYGRIEGWSISVFVGKKIKMMINPPPFFSDDMIKAHYNAHQSVLDFCNIMNKKWNFALSCPEPTTHRQYTITDPFAKSMMELVGGSQIKFETKEGIVDINQSNQQEERIEFDTFQQARRYLDVPDLIESLMKKLDKHYDENMKSMKLMAEGIFQNSKQITELVNFFKNNSAQVSNTRPESLLNSDDFNRMYQ